MSKVIFGKDVQVGDALNILGRMVRVIAIRPYDNAFARKVWPEGGVRIATFDIGGGITLEPFGRFDRAA